MSVNKGKNRLKIKLFHSVLAIIILSMVGFSTVSINQTYAADMYHMTTDINQNLGGNEDELTSSIGSLFDQFVIFIKSGIEKNNTKYTIGDKEIKKTNFTVAEEANKLLNSEFFNSNSKNSPEIESNFIDISGHPDSIYIKYLSDHNIISKNNKRFNPENFIRLHEVSKLFVNSYRHKLGYNLNNNIGLTDRNYFDSVTPNYYNTAYEMGLLKGLHSTKDFERFVVPSDIESIASNFNEQYPELINISNLDMPKSNRMIKRGEICKIIVKLFMFDNFKKDITFIDIASSKYQTAIESLAQLELIDTQTNKFYPDKIMIRSEFIKLLVKTYLHTANLDLVVDNINFNINDLDYNSDYAPYIIYAQEKGFIDYLFETKRDEIYVKPNTSITKHEAYHIISNMTNMQITYDIAQADKEYITKGELSQLIVDSFSLNKSTDNKYNSQLEAFVDDIKFLTKGRKLLSLLF